MAAGDQVEIFTEPKYFRVYQYKISLLMFFKDVSFSLVFFLRELFYIIPFLALKVFLQSVENMPSVQSFVATSRRPNICEAVIALGFILISRCGCPQSMKADHQLVLVLLFNSQRTLINSN